MDGLYVVALLDRKRCAQQQLGHAQHAVHGGADFMADLGQELGLGIDFGRAGRQFAADAELGLGDAAVAFAQGEAHQQAADAHHAHQRQHQLLRCDEGQAQQRRENHQGADIENHHRHGKHARWFVALLPVVNRYGQNADTCQSDQGIGNEVQRQVVDKQQQQATEGDNKNVQQQQFEQPMGTATREKTIGEHQPARGGQQQCQVGARGLQAVPLPQPGVEQVQEQH